MTDKMGLLELEVVHQQPDLLDKERKAVLEGLAGRVPRPPEIDGEHREVAREHVDVLGPGVVVQVETVQPSAYQIVVTAMGTVIPDREIVLKPRVSGEIVEIHPEFTEGGILKKGMKVLQIDPKDYELNLAQKQSAVTDAEYALKLELGHQEVAKREWELLNGTNPAQDMEKELALRKPHLDLQSHVPRGP